MKSTRPQKAYLALTLGVILIGTSAIFVKIANVHGIISAFYRIFFALLALFPLYLVRRRNTLPDKKYLGLIVAGGFVFAANIVIWNTAILLTSAATATLLSNNAPLWVGLGTLIILKEKLPAKYWIGLLVALIGMFIIVGTNAIQGWQPNAGDLLAVAASFLYAAFLLIIQKARTHTDTLTLNLLTMLTGTLILFPVSLLFQQALTGFNVTTWLALLGLGLLPQTIGWLAINYAMGHIPAARVSVILLGQPIVTVLLGIILLNEFLSFTTVLGGILVLVGIYLVNQRPASKKL